MECINIAIDKMIGLNGLVNNDCRALLLGSWWANNKGCVTTITNYNF